MLIIEFWCSGQETSDFLLIFFFFSRNFLLIIEFWCSGQEASDQPGAARCQGGQGSPGAARTREGSGGTQEVCQDRPARVPGHQAEGTRQWPAEFAVSGD